MKPYYQDSYVTLFHGDSRELLSGMEAADALVCDPPFGIGWGRATWSDDPAAYVELMQWLVSEANRIVTNGWVFVFQAMPNADRFHLWFPAGFRIFAACKKLRPGAADRGVALMGPRSVLVEW